MDEQGALSNAAAYRKGHILVLEKY